MSRIHSISSSDDGILKVETEGSRSRLHRRDVYAVEEQQEKFIKNLTRDMSRLTQITWKSFRCLLLRRNESDCRATRAAALKAFSSFNPFLCSLFIGGIFLAEGFRIFMDDNVQLARTKHCLLKGRTNPSNCLAVDFIARSASERETFVGLLKMWRDGNLLISMARQARGRFDPEDCLEDSFEARTSVFSWRFHILHAA